MEVVAFYEHLYQFIGHNKSEDDPGDWQNGSFGDLSYHCLLYTSPLAVYTQQTKPEQSKEVDGLEPPHT